MYNEKWRLTTRQRRGVCQRKQHGCLAAEDMNHLSWGCKKRPSLERRQRCSDSGMVILKIENLLLIITTIPGRFWLWTNAIFVRAFVKTDLLHPA